MFQQALYSLIGSLAAKIIAEICWFLAIKYPESTFGPVFLILGFLIVPAAMWLLLANSVVKTFEWYHDIGNDTFKPSLGLLLVFAYIVLATVGMFTVGKVSAVNTDGLNFVWYTQELPWAKIQVTNWHVFMFTVLFWGYVISFKQFSKEIKSFRRNKTEEQSVLLAREI
jgi:hypothetical protein